MSASLIPVCGRASGLLSIFTTMAGCAGPPALASGSPVSGHTGSGAVVVVDVVVASGSALSFESDRVSANATPPAITTTAIAPPMMSHSFFRVTAIEALPSDG